MTHIEQMYDLISDMVRATIAGMHRNQEEVMSLVNMMKRQEVKRDAQLERILEQLDYLTAALRSAMDDDNQ